MIVDKEVLDYFIDKKRNAIISARINKTNLLKNTPQYKEYLEKRYGDFRGDYCEIIYRIYHHIENIPCCKKCGSNLKYHGFKENSYGTWCSCKCQLSDADFIKERESNYTEKDKINRVKKMKKTCLEKYGDENYHNKEKCKSTCLEKYGSESPLNKNSPLRKKWEDENLKKYGKRTNTNPQKIAETKLKKYGDAAYCNREKAKKTMIERYGVKTTMESSVLSEKTRKTKKERYGDENYINREKTKQTMLKKYGVENPFQLTSVRNKIDYEKVVDTKRKNHTFNSSKEEKRMMSVLENYFPNYTIISGYQDNRYKNPENGNLYVCDFYIKELDLFIELNGHYTHGKHPFDKTNKNDIALLNEYKKKTKPSYKVIIEVWTKRDVIKRNVAIENKLNYITFYGTSLSEEEIVEEVSKYEKSINISSKDEIL